MSNVVQGVYGFRTILDAMQQEHHVQERSETLRSVCRWINMTVPSAPDTLIPYTMSAMFYVSGKALRKYPKQFYEDARSWLIYDDETGKEPLRNAPTGSGVDTCNYLRQAGRRGYLLERLWQYMFTGIEKPALLRPSQRNWVVGGSPAIGNEAGEGMDASAAWPIAH